MPKNNKKSLLVTIPQKDFFNRNQLKTKKEEEFLVFLFFFKLGFNLF